MLKFSSFSVNLWDTLVTNFCRFHLPKEHQIYFVLFSSVAVIFIIVSLWIVISLITPDLPEFSLIEILTEESPCISLRFYSLPLPFQYQLSLLFYSCRVLLPNQTVPAYLSKSFLSISVCYFSQCSLLCSNLSPCSGEV